LASKDTAFYSKKTLNISGNVLDLTMPRIMGILNVTDDSFYDGGRYCNPASISRQVERMIGEGVDIIDIGGYSSRPNAQHIDEEAELQRVKVGIEAARAVSKKVPISVDTFRSGIAQKSLEWGADMINDISGGELDKRMIEVISDTKVPYIIMHMKGTPQDMMNQTDYDDIISDLVDDLAKKVQKLTNIGIKDVIIDVGFGFSKTLEQNHKLLHHLRYFKSLNMPLLVGISRKSMIFRALKCDPEQTLNGTTALHSVAVLAGAEILRVHDVKEAKEVVKLLNIAKR
jgi:dihydropteroate synthase